LARSGRKERCQHRPLIGYQWTCQRNETPTLCKPHNRVLRHAGRLHIAEPGALIGFAGPRVIEQTIREKLPEGFQKSEYLKEHGMVDMVVHRHDMRATLARLCRVLTKAPAVDAPAPALVPEEVAVSAE
jgi:hypothetical protein